MRKAPKFGHLERSTHTNTSWDIAQASGVDPALPPELCEIGLAGLAAVDRRLLLGLPLGRARQQAAGGDARGRQSAAVLVVREGAGYMGANDRLVDLRNEPIPHLQPKEEEEEDATNHSDVVKEDADGSELWTETYERQLDALQDRIRLLQHRAALRRG